MQSSRPDQRPHEIHLHERRTEQQAETRKLQQLKKRLLVMLKKPQVARAS
jgi:hypothetical protein